MEVLYIFIYIMLSLFSIFKTGSIPCWNLSIPIQNFKYMFLFFSLFFYSQIYFGRVYLLQLSPNAQEPFPVTLGSAVWVCCFGVLI